MPYLFSRRGRLAPGNVLDAMTWAAKITEKVNAISEVPVSLWTTEFSPQVGTLSWTAVVDDLSQLRTLDTKLMADSGYLSLVEEGARYTSDAGLDDGLVNLITPMPTRSPASTRRSSVRSSSREASCGH